MTNIVFAEPAYVHLIWLMLTLVAALAVLELRMRDTLGLFLSAEMQSRLVHTQSLTRRIVKLVLVTATLTLGVLALMRPQTPGGTETLSRNIRSDVMVVLDVSKSMLAEDAAPNRLDRAKAEIIELIERVKDHRLGLVVFAGRASVKSPLTSDYGFFRLVLRNVGPDSVSRGGTRIGDAVRKATRAFGPNRGVPRVMLLITDGEDHESYPEDAVKEAVEAGIRIVTIGFGSEDGSQITLTDPSTGARRLLTDSNGVAVVSRLDGDLLREIALMSEGVYIPAGTSAVDLDAIVETHVQPLVEDDSARIERRNPTEHYPWLVLGAMLSLIAAVWVGASIGPPATEVT
jgi:Ca-activated chloride channel family protein|tara:strand:- start:7220 stop:8254 length:1035 start_codon:yes stop_codon:yes gene_type:complete